MSTRFADANTNGCKTFTLPSFKSAGEWETARAANDNGSYVPSENLLRAALRHFSQHGLGAAREARVQAEAAFFKGDRAAYNYWLGITRTLDRRMASHVQDRLDLTD